MSTRKKNASYVYDDLLCRASLSDTGEIPRTPPLEESPDVIPVGSTKVEDPHTYFTGNYNENVAEPVVAEEQNFIYVRGKNLSELATNGDIYLYWAPQDQRNEPAVWQGHQLLTADGHGTVLLPNVEPDAVAVGETPFSWIPDSAMGGREVAIMAVLATNEHPNPVPSLKPPFNFDAWIARKGGIGTWKTLVKEAPPKPKTVITNAQFALKNTEGMVTFALRTSNMPIGSIVSFRSSKPDKDGNPIESGPTKVTVNPFVFTIDANVEANFNTRIEFDLTLPTGQKPTADNYVGVGASQIPQGSSKPILLAQYNTQIKAPIATA